MNVFTVSGNIGRDAETSFTPNNKAMTKFSLAVTTGWGDKTATMWINCTCWGDRYQKLAQYITKGKTIVVSGELAERAYESNGEQRKSLDLTVRELDLPPKAQGSSQQSAPRGQDIDSYSPF